MRNKKLRIYTYIGAIFVAGYTSIPAYINSSFISEFLSEQGIGWFYAIASSITIILIIITPILIRHFGNRTVLISFVCLSLLAIIPLAFPTLKVIHILTALSIYIILGYLTRYTLDVYLEKISENKKTGMIRGLFMTFYNLAWLASPLLATYLISHGGYNLVYGAAGIALIPLLLISVFFLKENPQTKTETTVWQELKRLCFKKTQTTSDIKNILIVDFLLNFFYAIMVIYMPLYLHSHLGLAWIEIGYIFSIMLLPFVLFELPLGKIADKWLGEKEILIGGITITSLATIACFSLQSDNWILWAILLFLTRTGASTIEIMKETYLFKKINGLNTGVVSLSRINVPFSYIIGPIFASLVLNYFDFRFIFLFLGLIVLLAIKPTWHLKDTK